MHTLCLTIGQGFTVFRAMNLAIQQVVYLIRELHH